MEEVMFKILMGQFTDIEDADMVGGLSEEMQDKSPLYAFTNQNGVNGAVCILYEDYLEEFAKKKCTDIPIRMMSRPKIYFLTGFTGILLQREK